ncbi:uncharacterized protein LOC143048275 isoform X3 [Mytilus galloprovincialis]|uniref:uncharacterized protein LOC143048275 isoform X3 n=1 Tax=Mytilus galloprovincialis TaxID=29158 RepID=UPI003F7C80AE
MSFEVQPRVLRRQRRAASEHEYKSRQGRPSRPLSYIPMKVFNSPDASSSVTNLNEPYPGRRQSASSMQSLAIEMIEPNLDDSFHKEVAEKTQMYFVGKKEAEIEVRIDRIVKKAGSKDKALLYVVSKIDDENEKTILAVLDCLIEEQLPSCNMTVYYHILESDEEGRTPIQDGFNKESKTPLQMIAKSGNKTLVYHDIVRLLIRRKWKEYARKRFIVNTVLHLITLLALTFSSVVAVSAPDPSVYDTSLQVFRAIFEVWTCVMSLVTVCSEVNQLRKHKKEYFHDPFNYIDLPSSLLILSAIPLRALKLNEQWPVLSVAFLFWVLRIFKYAAVLRQTGAYAQILWRVLRHDFIQFTFVFLVMLLAFSGAFMLSLKGEHSMEIHSETSSFWKILFLGVRILIEAERIIEYSELKPMSCIIMVMFLFTCCVVLLNILIAQLSDTYQNVQQDAQRGLEVNRAWIVARVELNSLYLGKNHRTTHYKESEDIKDVREVLERWETPPLNEMNKHIQDIYDSLDSHKMNLLTVRNRLARQESTLGKIQEQLELIIQLQKGGANQRDSSLSDILREVVEDVQPIKKSMGTNQS